MVIPPGCLLTHVGQRRKPAHATALNADSGADLSFSRDVIVLTINGAEVDLNLIDLPGLIHSHDQGNGMVGLIKQLTEDYIK
jgi:hypothetical protein